MTPEPQRACATRAPTSLATRLTTLLASMMLATAMLATVGAARAEAQSPFGAPPPAGATWVECGDGRIGGPLTAGRCCWPGQSWSAAEARCAGPPTCPAGLTAHGDECVPARGTTQASQAGGSYAGGSYAPSYASDPDRPRTSIRHGLVGAGVTFFLAGYVAAATYGPILGSGCDASGLYWLLPLAGPLVGTATQRCYSGYYGYTSGPDWADWSMAAVTTAFQLVGLIMTIVGNADRRLVTVAFGPERSRRAVLELAPVPTLRF